MIGRGPRLKRLQEELTRIIKKIDKTGVRKIILFGSLATGRVGLTSDIDLIIVKNTKQRFLDRLDSVYMDIEPNVGVDIFVYTPREINDMSRWNSFIRRALRDGKVLYEAA
ncbi:MAG: nucleotidyltransferase domain-containing protein [Candidatus Omnitrophica bacterium]|nr:nucleotidyltransferase domain-containing protein [Candidatus Omnitrophota bacterium]MBU4478276.1 nucleotidyltransferase domain-containing protein [Candidatus Omnitrophota bacterium]MCG2703344.1 nucleotidyltransferase domain-containing protein [Candidatus Omnitrophota bacterium]